MNIIPYRNRKGSWSPFRELENIQEEMNKLFNLSLGRFFGGDSERLDGGEFLPALEINDGKNNLRISLEVPGVEKNDLSVSIEGDTLTIKGQKKKEEKIEKDGVIRTERSYGSFCRSIALPPSVDASKAQAQYKNGVLELTFPKKEEAKPKQIAIEVKGD